MHAVGDEGVDGYSERERERGMGPIVKYVGSVDVIQLVESNTCCAFEAFRSIIMVMITKESAGRSKATLGW